MFKRLYFLFFMVLLSSFVSAQEERLLDQLKDDEKSVIEAIALYPEKERLAILEASGHPEILVRIQRIQIQTSADFKKLVSPLSEFDQRKIYNVSRYPELVDEVCAGNKKKSAKEIETLTVGYPEELSEQLQYLQKHHWQLLQDANYLYITSNKAFSNTISNYPEEVKNAYRDLIKLPEVMSILTDNMTMTVLMGDLYNNKPEQLKSELDSLNLVVAEQKAKELKDWQESLENDPEALAEYQKATQEFADEQGYSATDYSRSYPDNYTTQIYVYNRWAPYPYWFGCPSWYPYDYWYPYSWWYHWGYYYGPGNVIVFVGLPSPYFVYWHFYSYGHHHFYNYPHLTNHLISYHDHHRHYSNPINGVVDHWERDNEPNLPKNWLKEDEGRVNRIKELGEFNQNYDLEKQKTPTITEREYLKNNADDYPNLKPVLKEKPQTVKEPVIKQKPTQREPANVPVTTPKERSRVIERPQSNQQEIERAKTHHENTWQIRKPPVQREPVYRTPTRTTPTRTAPTIKQPVQKNIPRNMKKGGGK